MIIAALPRNPLYSPSMEEKDKALFTGVVDALRKEGNEVDILDEKEEEMIQRRYTLIFHMAREKKLLQQLCEEEKKGTPILNSPQGVANCSRGREMRLLEEAKIPQPRFFILFTDRFPPELPYPAWIKKEEGWSCQSNDVCHVRNRKECFEALQHLHQQGITKAIYTEHLCGDLVKFYGVQHSRFFHWYYPGNDTAKQHLTQFNGKAEGYPFSIEELRKTASKAASTLQTAIYGGDAIISPKGNIHLIDFNDCPSFSPCRREAIEAIIECVRFNLKRQR